MGRIVVTEFISMHGVIEAPARDEKEFKHSGWSFEVSRGTEGDKFKLDEAFSSNALLLGRKTYQGFAAAWPISLSRPRRRPPAMFRVRKGREATESPA